MIFNNGYPVNPQMYPQNTQYMQMQNTGFIPVQSEEEARAWAVAPGNSVTFKDENAPYCYTKSMGFSQLDQPKFEKYRLVKEEDPVEQKSNAQNNALNDVFDEINELKDRIQKLERKSVKVKKTNDEEEDE